MGGSGGGGTQTSTNVASYPEEFKPLATSARKQIQGLQQALPLVGFAQPNPGQTAGISPFQQATMNFIPNLLAPSWGLSTLQNLDDPITQLAGNAINVGNQTDPYTQSLNALRSGGFGAGSQSFPGAPFQPPESMTPPQMTQVAPQATILGPGNEQLIATLMSQLTGPLPTTTPVLNAPIMGQVPPRPTLPSSRPGAPPPAVAPPRPTGRPLQPTNSGGRTLVPQPGGRPPMYV